MHARASSVNSSNTAQPQIKLVDKKKLLDRSAHFFIYINMTYRKIVAFIYGGKKYSPYISTDKI